MWRSVAFPSARESPRRTFPDTVCRAELEAREEDGDELCGQTAGHYVVVRVPGISVMQRDSRAKRSAGQGGALEHTAVGQRSQQVLTAITAETVFVNGREFSIHSRRRVST